MNRLSKDEMNVIAEHVGIKLKWTVSASEQLLCSYMVNNEIRYNFDPYCNSVYKKIIRNLTTEKANAIEEILLNIPKFAHADTILRSFWMIDTDRENVIKAFLEVHKS